MNLDRLAVRAKTSEKHLKLLLKKTKKFRVIFSAKMPVESKIKMDVDGEMITLTWNLVRRFDENRRIHFLTFMMWCFNKFVAREYAIRNREIAKGKNRVDIDSLDMVSEGEGSDVLTRDIISAAENNFRGVEKLFFARAIIGRESVNSVASRYNIKRRRAYEAKRNIRKSILILMKDEPTIVESLLVRSIKMRGIMDDLNYLMYKERR